MHFCKPSDFCSQLGQIGSIQVILELENFGIKITNIDEKSVSEWQKRRYEEGINPVSTPCHFSVSLKTETNNYIQSRIENIPDGGRRW